MEKKDWVDFVLVKSVVSFEMLIVHYEIVVLSRKDDEARLKCPFHNGKTESSMSINLAKNTFYCFGCKARGNVLDFVAKKEKCSVKDAAFKLNTWFEIDGNSTAEDSEREAIKAENEISPFSIIENIESQLAQLKQLLTSH